MADVMPDCGGAWVPDDSGGGGGGGPPPCVLEQMSKLAGHGIVISGVITWMQAQIDTFGTDIWRSLAERCFLAGEVTAAKEALRSARGPVLETLLPEFKTNRSGLNKKSKELDDIRNAIGTLTQTNQMPLVLATAQQMVKCPQSWGVPESPTSQDVMGKIYHLEKALSDSIELQKENMNKIKEEIVSIKTSGPRPQIPLVTLTQDTPNSKKRKLEEQQQQYQQEQQEQQQQQQQQHHHQSYAGIAGISPLAMGQQQQSMRLIQSILQKKQPQTSKNLCFGSAKTTTEGGDGTKLSGDVSLVASGVAKDCTEEDMKKFLADKGIKVVECEILTKPEVLALVRTITFRVSVKAADYEAALKPEVWPYRVGVRHYRAPRRPDRADSGWRGQSSQSGGNINADNTGGPGSGGGGHTSAPGSGAGGHAGGRQQFPPGHPSRAGPKQQYMAPRQPGPVEMSNFWNVLHSLGGEAGLISQP